MNPTIPAISLWNPYGFFVAVLEKEYETRSWPTRVRGDVLICAAKKHDAEASAALESGLTDVRTVYQRARELYAETGDRDHLQALATAEKALRQWENGLWLDGRLSEHGY